MGNDMHTGVVLMPGMSLPLRFCPGQAPLIEGILQAPEPYTRLLAVVRRRSLRLH